VAICLRQHFVNNRSINSYFKDVALFLDRTCSKFDRLESLGVALFDLSNITDLNNWLNRHFFGVTSEYACFQSIVFGKVY
jgi:hypothetical protein